MSTTNKPSYPTRTGAGEIARTLRYPPSAARVLPLLKRMLQDASVSIHQIAEIIRLDPGIAARVLHAANSAFYNRGGRCLSVEMAVNRIGFDHIYEMVANAAAEQVLVIPLNSYALEADEFWLGSVACAVAAERIAQDRDLDPNVAYTLGLMSGIGMVAIDQWLQANDPHIVLFKRDFPRDHVDSERVLLGCTHSEVGALVLQSWEFPPEMSLPLRWQYEPWEAIGYRQLAAMLHCAKWAAAQARRADERLLPLPDNRALASLGLSTRQLAALVEEVRARLGEVQRRLEIQPLEAA